MQLLLTELMKWKRSPILVLIAVSALVPVLVTVNLLLSESPGYVTWSYILVESHMVALKYIPAFLGLLAGYVFSRETLNGTMSALLTSPVRRGSLMTAKLLVMLPVIVLIHLLLFLLALLLGILTADDTLSMHLLFSVLRVNLLAAILHFGLIPAIAAVSMAGRSYLLPIVFSLGSSLSMFAMLLTRYRGYFPWCLPSIAAARLLFPYSGDWNYLLIQVSQYPVAIAAFIAVFILPLLFCVYSFYRTDFT